METLLIGLLIAGLLLMAAGIFLGRKRRVTVDQVAGVPDDAGDDEIRPANEPGSAVSLEKQP